MWHGFFDPLFDPGVGDKNRPLPTLFCSNQKFYFNEILHEDSMPSRNFKNVEIWALVTHMIITMA